jgi:hypothetical protein
MTLHIYNEEWRAVPGHDGYEVSNLGRVRSYRAHGGNRGGRLLDQPHMKATRRHNTGYLSVVLQVGLNKSQPYPVHILVASAFLGPRPEGLHVAHADGDKMNARLDNLRYATALENAQDKHRHGTTCRGETNTRAKITAAEVQRIIAAYATGQLQKDIAKEFGISQSQVSNIVRGAQWSHLGAERAS